MSKTLIEMPGKEEVLRLRKTLRLTQKEFGKIFAVKGSTIARWELGIDPVSWKHYPIFVRVREQATAMQQLLESFEKQDLDQ